MWKKSIGLIILLEIACVLTKGADEDSRTSDGLIDKEYKLIFVQAAWYTANQFCTDHGMLLASINSLEEQKHLESLIRDKNMFDEDFWISKSKLTPKGAFDWTANKNIPKFSNWEPSNQCILWYWMNVELCYALWPLTNEWNYDHCDKRKYFICERTRDGKRKLLISIKEEFVKLVDEVMLSGFVEALSTATDNTWFNLVKGALNMWMEEQQVLKSKSLIDEKVHLLAKELTELTKTTNILNSDELREFVKQEFDDLQQEERVPLLSERFRKLIGYEYKMLEEMDKAAGNMLPSDEAISVLAEKVIMLAKVQQAKLAQEEISKMPDVKTSDTLNESQLKMIGQNLIKFSEEEFKVYVLEVMNQLEYLGVAEFDVDTFIQLYMLVKQELFSLISTSIIKTTLKNRYEITSYVVSRILNGDILRSIEEDSIFRQIFVLIATGLAVLAEEKSIPLLDDAHIRGFVKNEFEGLKGNALVDLKYDGYSKFVQDEFIKLATLTSEMNLAKNEDGQLLLENIIELIASQLFYYGVDEMKMIAEQLALSREEESNKLEIIAEQAKTELYMYDGDKLTKLFQLASRELFAITKKSLVKFTDEQVTQLAEEGLSKLLDGDIFKSFGERSIFGKVFISLGKELLTLTQEEFAILSDNELHELVKLEFEKSKYEQNIELFEEVYLKLVAEEFIELAVEGTITLTAYEEGKHQFGEMVNAIARKLLGIVRN